jgi:hypothetical protein
MLINALLRTNRFIQSDPWWSLAMAINVFMVFFMGASPSTFKKWGWLYCGICYGGPLIIAVVCLMLRNPNKALVYGSAGVSPLTLLARHYLSSDTC